MRLVQVDGSGRVARAAGTNAPVATFSDHPAHNISGAAEARRYAGCHLVAVRGYVLLEALAREGYGDLVADAAACLEGALEEGGFVGLRPEKTGPAPAAPAGPDGGPPAPGPRPAKPAGRKAKR